MTDLLLTFCDFACEQAPGLIAGALISMYAALLIDHIVTKKERGTYGR